MKIVLNYYVDYQVPNLDKRGLNCMFFINLMITLSLVVMIHGQNAFKPNLDKERAKDLIHNYVVSVGTIFQENMPKISIFFI